MFTAKDVAKLVKENDECPNLDYFIENSLVKQFMASPKATVSAAILRVNNWTSKGFMFAMVQRGFNVAFVTDQRDGDFYTITYPPQER